MHTLPTRIRKARLAAQLTQAEMARRIGVKRSAATQWEHPLGTSPSMHHLIQIAIETGTCVEWLGTGRGPSRCDGTETAPALPREDCAQDASESEALLRFRKLPAQKRKIALQMLKVLSS